MSTHTVHIQSAKLPLHGSIGAWMALQELPKHLANLLPFLLGTVLAFRHAGTVDWAVFAVSLIALFLLTDGTYIANEYFDFESDSANATRIGGDDHVGVTTTGGTRVLVKGLVARRHALIAAVACMLLAIPVGAWLQFGMGTGPMTVPLGAIALFIGWFYSAPPIRAAYRGLGEVFIAVGQGAVVFGGYYVQQGYAATPLKVALPWVLALPALKVLREFPDYESDREYGKNGLTVIFGRERMAYFYVLMVTAAIVSFAAVWPMLRPGFALITLIPVALLGRSAWIILRGEWRESSRLETAAVSGFGGMLMIPATLIVAFLGDAML